MPQHTLDRVGVMPFGLQMLQAITPHLWEGQKESQTVVGALRWLQRFGRVRKSWKSREGLERVGPGVEESWEGLKKVGNGWGGSERGKCVSSLRPIFTPPTHKTGETGKQENQGANRGTWGGGGGWMKMEEQKHSPTSTPAKLDMEQQDGSAVKSSSRMLLLDNTTRSI